MTTGFKLALGGLIVTVVTCYMAYQGAATSWQYYLTVDECMEGSAKLDGSRLRVHGQVVLGSLQIAPNRNLAEFQLAGQRTHLNVITNGTIPDNLKEQIEVVVEGRLIDSGTLGGERVLTKCASKYQSQDPAANSAGGTIAKTEKGS
jgi:cytochrome c-type biogenesis protein CcmE